MAITTNANTTTPSQEVAIIFLYARSFGEDEYVGRFDNLRQARAYTKRHETDWYGNCIHYVFSKNPPFEEDDYFPSTDGL